MKVRGLVKRIYWIINLRWIAVAGVLGTTIFVPSFLGIRLNQRPLFLIAAVLAGYNILFLLLLRVVVKRKMRFDIANADAMANIQISLDLICLAGLIHFSGGVENPFIFYFIFHVIIASSLLSRSAAFLHATFAVALYVFIAVAERAGWISHYCLQGFLTCDLHSNIRYIIGVSFVFISTMYIGAYMATSIAQRLRKRERSLREANALLMKKDTVKSEYVLRVTHDIKEHLAAIQSCIAPVTRKITGPLNKQQMDLLSTAEERSGKLIFFVKALLEITRMKLSKDEMTGEFIFKNALNEAIAQVASRASEKNVAITSRVDPAVTTIRGTREYIQEVLINLIANAVKYTPAGGKVEIVVDDAGDSISIRIKDTGIGIPKAELPNVFDEFFRASNAKALVRDGTGLGLSIAKQVIERHNGTISVESEEGKGSLFTIELPK